MISEHFKRSEFACKCGCGFDTVDIELIQILEEVRWHFNEPITINSGNRCKKHNASIGGSKNSQHLYGRAADFVVGNLDQNKVADWCSQRWPNKYGIGWYRGRSHIDSRTGKARWRSD